MGRIVPLDPPEEEVVTGYTFRDEDDVDDIVVKTIYEGSLATISYNQQFMEFTKDEARKLIRALNKVIAEHMPDDAD